MNEHARVTVTLNETVAPGKNARSDFRQDIHNHVPGSVLRGAVAAVWLRHLGRAAATTPEFIEIFDGEGSFGPLHSTASPPIPLSVRVHKYEPTPRCRQLWWDAALGDIAESCPRCESPLEFSKGQPRGTVDTTTRTMTALSTDGVALDGSLFSQAALSKGLRLQGWLHGKAVNAFCLDGSPVTSLLLGSRRSLRGSATVELDHDAVPDPVESVGNDIILRLAAPAVFVDDYGLPGMTPDPIELSEVLGVTALEVTSPAWTRWDEVGGWHAASGLPKPTERAVAAGSTYRVRCAEPPSEAARRTLMARGIGLRRREGFGALFRTEAPRGFAAWTGLVAPLRRRPELLPIFRNRLNALRRGGVNDAILHTALQKIHAEPDYIQAFQTMLGITDADLYEHLLEFLERA